MKFEERKSSIYLDIEYQTCWGKYRINQTVNEEDDVIELWNNSNKIILSIVSDNCLFFKDFFCIQTSNGVIVFYKNLTCRYDIPYDSQFNPSTIEGMVDFNGHWLLVCCSSNDETLRVYELDRLNLKFEEREMNTKISRNLLIFNPRHESSITSFGIVLRREVIEFHRWEDLLGKEAYSPKVLEKGINVAFYDPNIYVFEHKDTCFAYDLAKMEKLWEADQCWNMGFTFLVDDNNVFNPSNHDRIFTASNNIVAITNNEDLSGYIIWTSVE